MRNIHVHLVYNCGFMLYCIQLILLLSILIYTYTYITLIEFYTIWYVTFLCHFIVKSIYNIPYYMFKLRPSTISYFIP